LQNVTRKIYNQKVDGGVYTFSALVPLFALLFFIIPLNGRFDYSLTTFWFSLGFATTYVIGVIGTFLAISTGPLSLSSLIIAYSLIVPACYGLIFLNEPISTLLIVGIVLLLISLFLINVEKKGEKKEITLKWTFYAFLGFIGNGGCSTVQKLQPLYCDGKHKNEFMIVALLISTIVMFIPAIIKERQSIKENFVKGFPFHIICGIANGAVNYLVILLSVTMAASLMFPLISAGGIVLTVLISIFVYKEKLSREQIIGVILGVGAIVALNI